MDGAARGCARGLAGCRHGAPGRLSAPRCRMAVRRSDAGPAPLGQTARAVRPAAQMGSQIRPAWRGLAAVPMLLVLFGATGLWVRETAVPANSGLTAEVHVTQRGGRTPLTLPDGSRVRLNTATRLRTVITPTLRSVWLDEGEAYFEITHDPKRPFEVIAGSQRVRVLGTTFSVRREPNGLRVSVLEGRVQLDRDRGNRRILLTRGDVALANDQHVVIGKRSARQLLDELGWLEGKLIFEQARLADVAFDSSAPAIMLVVLPATMVVPIQAADIAGFRALQTITARPRSALPRRVC